MLKRFVLLLFLGSSLVLACGLHQETGFSLALSPVHWRSLAMSSTARQDDELNNLNKPDHF